MQSWLLDYLATTLDLSTILELHTIKKNCLPIEDELKNFDINISGIVLIVKRPT